MKLTLKRKFLGANYTIGDLFIDDKFFSNTIEDTVRELPSNGRKQTKSAKKHPD